MAIRCVELMNFCKQVGHVRCRSSEAPPNPRGRRAVKTEGLSDAGDNGIRSAVGLV